VIDSVTATVNAWTSDLGTGPLAYELHDGKTGVLIGTQQAGGPPSGNSFHYDTVTFQAPSQLPSWAQLYWLALWIYADQGAAPSGAVVSVDYASLQVAYEPSGIPFAAPATSLAAAAGTAPDANGPSGRIFVDITLAVGPTLSRAQAVVAAATQGDGTTAGLVVSDRGA
jgi:hypothetical protein